MKDTSFDLKVSSGEENTSRLAGETPGKRRFYQEVNSLNSFENYGTVRTFPNFSGPFFQWYLNFNVNREKGTVDRFVVFSSGKRPSVVNHLWLKLVWDTLSYEEFLFFLTLPEVLKNDKFVGFLRTKNEVPLKVLRSRLLEVENFLGLLPSTRERYIGTKRLKILIQRERISLSRVPKYSGYVKSLAARGKGRRGTGEPEPVPYIFVDLKEETNWYFLLSVGDFNH